MLYTYIFMCFANWHLCMIHSEKIHRTCVPSSKFMVLLFSTYSLDIVTNVWHLVPSSTNSFLDVQQKKPSSLTWLSWIINIELSSPIIFKVIKSYSNLKRKVLLIYHSSHQKFKLLNSKTRWLVCTYQNQRTNFSHFYHYSWNHGSDCFNCVKYCMVLFLNLSANRQYNHSCGSQQPHQLATRFV
jgi:hypothetical protein